MYFSSYLWYQNLCQTNVNHPNHWLWTKWIHSLLWRKSGKTRRSSWYVWRFFCPICRKLVNILAFCLFTFGDALLEGGGGHVHSCHRHSLGYCSDRTSHLPHENSGKQTYNHGRTSFWNATTNVVWIWLTVLDDVGRRDSGCNIKVRKPDDIFF